MPQLSLRLVTRLRQGRRLVWEWAPVPPERLAPGAPVPALLGEEGGGFLRRQRARVQPCPTSEDGRHWAMLEVPGSTAPEAGAAHAGKAMCVRCKDPVPREASCHVRDGWIWNTPDGELHPGDCFWMAVEAGMATSAPARAFSRSAEGSHLIVVLPTGEKWDTFAPMYEDSDEGWTLRGAIPGGLTADPAVEVDNWTGRVTNGELTW